MARRFITEQFITRNPDSVSGGTLVIGTDDVLTAAARDYVKRKRLTVRRGASLCGTSAEVCGSGAPVSGNSAARHPLTDKPNQVHTCAACGQPVTEKGEKLTSLDGKVYVPKDHPRIAFRGEIDILTAEAVCLIAWAPEPFKPWARDLRSFLGNLLKAEVDQTPLGALSMGPFDEAALRTISHKPETFLNIGHRVPGTDETAFEASVNRLRAMVRKAELSACGLDPEDRLGFVRGLNRLSSACYVFYLFLIAVREGRYGN